MSIPMWKYSVCWDPDYPMSKVLHRVRIGKGRKPDEEYLATILSPWKEELQRLVQQMPDFLPRSKVDRNYWLEALHRAWHDKHGSRDHPYHATNTEDATAYTLAKVDWWLKGLSQLGAMGVFHINLLRRNLRVFSRFAPFLQRTHGFTGSVINGTAFPLIQKYGPTYYPVDRDPHAQEEWGPMVPNPIVPYSYQDERVPVLNGYVDIVDFEGSLNPKKEGNLLQVIQIACGRIDKGLRGVLFNVWGDPRIGGSKVVIEKLKSSVPVGFTLIQISPVIRWRQELVIMAIVKA